jgi:hypothetical protein
MKSKKSLFIINYLYYLSGEGWWIDNLRKEFKTVRIFTVNGFYNKIIICTDDIMPVYTVEYLEASIEKMYGLPHQMYKKVVNTIE